MKNIIWTKEELKKIRNIILLNAGLKVNDDNEISKNLSGPRSLNGNSQYNIVLKELEDLFYIEDDEKIINVLNKINEVDYDQNNEEHYGITTNIVRLDKNDRTQIFNIFKEICGNFRKEINNFATEFVNRYIYFSNMTEYFDFINNHGNEIYNNLCEYIDSSFDNVKVVTDNEIFKPLIEKLYNESMNLFIKETKEKITHMAKAQNSLEQKSYNGYKRIIRKKLQKGNLRVRKREK